MFSPELAIKLRTAPSPIIAGQPATLIVSVITDQHVATDKLTITLVATGRHRKPSASPLLVSEAVKELCALTVERELRDIHPGTTRFELPILIPANAPATFRRESARCDWRAKLDLSIDWAFDKSETFEVLVDKPGQRHSSAAQKTRSWQRDDRSPMIESALSSLDIVLGREFEIHSAFSQIAPHKILQIDLRLLSILEPTGGSLLEKSTVTEEHSWCLHRGAIRDGSVLRSTLRVPSEVQPSMHDERETRRHQLAFAVVTEDGDPLHRTFAVNVVDPITHEPDGRKPTFEPIGEERVALAWAAIEREASRRAGSHATIDAVRQRAKIMLAKTEVILEERPHPIFGGAIVVELTSPPRALGLHVAHAPSLLAESDDDDVLDKLTAESFERASLAQCAIHAREPAQIEEAFSPVLRKLAERADDFTMNDERLRLWWAPIDLREDQIPAMFAVIDQLVDEFALFDSRTKPPSKLADLLEHTLAFVEKNGCSLTVGDLSVRRWVVHGRELRLFYEFTGPLPERTVIQLVETVPDGARPTEEDLRWVTERCRRSASLVDDRWTLTVSSALCIEECDVIASHFVQAITQLTQRERGPYR